MRRSLRRRGRAISSRILLSPVCQVIPRDRSCRQRALLRIRFRFVVDLGEREISESSVNCSASPMVRWRVERWLMISEKQSRCVPFFEEDAWDYAAVTGLAC